MSDKGRLGLLLFLVVCAAGCSEAEPQCGDAICSEGESVRTCAVDCDFDVVVVVESDLYEALEPRVTAYVQGLITDGFKGYAVPFAPAPVAELRTFLLRQWARHNIENAFLVGNLPTAWYEQQAFGEPEEFPMDIYLEDLDGTFADSDGNGVLDTHGQISLEIATSRITGEVSALARYFDRVNRYRRNGPLISPSAFVFIDDEWSWFASKYGVDELYEEVKYVFRPSESTMANYVEALTTGSAEFVLQIMHADVNVLYFQGRGGGSLNADQIRDYNFRCSFVHLWNCFAARFVSDHNLAMIYTVENEQGLAAIGSTKKGAVRKPELLHSRFALGEPLGEAFRSWYTAYGHTDDEWALGIVVFGDPMLNVWGDVTGLIEGGLASSFGPENLGLMHRIIQQHPTPPDLDTFDDYKRAHPEFFEE